MATATEEIVREEQETYDADAAADEAVHEEAPAAKKDGELFDRDAYQAPGLRIDTVDGQEVDKIWIAFKGKVALDRTNPADVALFNKLRLGAELELRVAGKGSAVGTRHTTSRGGDLDAVVGERTIDIHTAYVLGVEELG